MVQSMYMAASLPVCNLAEEVFEGGDLRGLCLARVYLSETVRETSSERV